MSDPRPVIFGEVLFDCFEDGSRVLGGAPFNVAWHLAAFGCDPLLISRVGCDRGGDEVLATMTRAGMRVDGIGRDPVHATGEVRVTLDAGEPTFDILDQRAFDHIEPPAFARPPLVYHGTLVLRHVQGRTALDAVVGEPPAPVFLDVNLRPPWWRPELVEASLARARWVKMNDAELTLLVPVNGSPVSRARALLERHDLERIIVTRGEHGVLSVGRDAATFEAGPAATVPVVDTVGAGDAFAAVCIAGLLRGWRWDDTLDRALDFAAQLVGRRGAIIDEPGPYRERLRAWS